MGDQASLSDEVASLDLSRTHEGHAPYASLCSRWRGRRVEERPCPMRSPFQRDRDRIIHSSSFRRLTYKTQVFVHHEGDYYRTRLTHSLEVAQIARAIARTLALDEDLAEALALAHDLGHSPFGHAGERALDGAMGDFGGFDHNAQSLRVVTHLEARYADFDGLNLSWEALEGLVKHNGPLLGPHAAGGGAGGSEVHRTILAYNRRHDLALDQFASPEAQVAAIADDIAYNTHDIDDGLRAGLIDIDMLRNIPLTDRFIAQVETERADLGTKRRIYAVTRRLLTALIYDAVMESKRRLEALAPVDVDEIRGAGGPVIGLSPDMERQLDALRDFLFRQVYRHERVMRVMRHAERIVADLFECYMDDPGRMPAQWSGLAKGRRDVERATIVCDFVAGMTDRFAVREHRRLFDATPDLG